MDIGWGLEDILLDNFLGSCLGIAVAAAFDWAHMSCYFRIVEVAAVGSYGCILDWDSLDQTLADNFYFD